MNSLWKDTGCLSWQWGKELENTLKPLSPLAGTMGVRQRRVWLSTAAQKPVGVGEGSWQSTPPPRHHQRQEGGATSP